MKLRKHKGQYIISEAKFPFSAEIELENGGELEVELSIIDNRIITQSQRNFIFKLCEEFAYYSGEDKEYWRLLLQQFNANIRSIEVESLSKCSVEYANGLIDTIITFAIDNEIPIAKNILDENAYKFDKKQVYALILKRQCVICGQRADVHHIDAVGMGNDRAKISHIGKRAISLCRLHHSEAHTIGNEAFLEKYHLTPVTIDKKLEYFLKNGKIKSFNE